MFEPRGLSRPIVHSFGAIEWPLRGFRAWMYTLDASSSSANTVLTFLAKWYILQHARSLLLTPSCVICLLKCSLVNSLGIRRCSGVTYSRGKLCPVQASTALLLLYHTSGSSYRHLVRSILVVVLSVGACGWSLLMPVGRASTSRSCLDPSIWCWLPVARGAGVADF
jgi:hypothetical protein